VLGAIILAVVMLVMVPLILVVGGVLFAILGWSVQKEVEENNEGSELIELNR
jgi:hypothetical protein